jgi:hypothetical protein
MLPRITAFLSAFCRLVGDAFFLAGLDKGKTVISTYLSGCPLNILSNYFEPNRTASIDSGTRNLIIAMFCWCADDKRLPLFHGEYASRPAGIISGKGRDHS